MKRVKLSIRNKKEANDVVRKLKNIVVEKCAFAKLLEVLSRQINSFAGKNFDFPNDPSDLEIMEYVILLNDSLNSLIMWRRLQNRKFEILDNFLPEENNLQLNCDIEKKIYNFLKSINTLLNRLFNIICGIEKSTSYLIVLNLIKLLNLFAELYDTSFKYDSNLIEQSNFYFEILKMFERNSDRTIELVKIMINLPNQSYNDINNLNKKIIQLYNCKNELRKKIEKIIKHNEYIPPPPWLSEIIKFKK